MDNFIKISIEREFRIQRCCNDTYNKLNTQNDIFFGLEQFSSNLWLVRTADTCSVHGLTFTRKSHKEDMEAVELIVYANCILYFHSKNGQKHFEKEINIRNIFSEQKLFRQQNL